MPVSNKKSNKNVKLNKTSYIKSNPNIVKLIRQMQVALNLGRGGPLSKARKPREVGVKKLNNRKKILSNVPPGNWIVFQGSVPVGEEFAIRHPKSKKLVSLRNLKRSASATGGSNVKTLIKRYRTLEGNSLKG